MAQDNTKWECQTVNSPWAFSSPCFSLLPSLQHIHTFTQNPHDGRRWRCRHPWRLHAIWIFHLFTSLGAASWEKFFFFLQLMFNWRKASVHMAFPPTWGLPFGHWGNSDGLLLPQWCWQQQRPIPIAWGKCICLRLNGCSYCLLISLKPFRPLLQPLQHLRLFTCIMFFCSSPPQAFLLCPLPPQHCPTCVSRGGTCMQAMGYCFSNLADRGQYLCIVFQYSLLMLTEDRRPWMGHQKHSYIKNKTLAAAVPRPRFASHSSSTNGKPATVVVICISLKA